MLAVLPQTKLTVHIHYIHNKVVIDHNVFEGELSMSQEQQDVYQQLVGDGQASVTASAELSEMDYGNGGKVFVSVTLKVNQSEPAITSGVNWARHMATVKVWEAHEQMKQQLHFKGILK